MIVVGGGGVGGDSVGLTNQSSSTCADADCSPGQALILHSVSQVRTKQLSLLSISPVLSCPILLVKTSSELSWNTFQTRETVVTGYYKLYDFCEHHLLKHIRSDIYFLQL